MLQKDGDDIFLDYIDGDKEKISILDDESDN